MQSIITFKYGIQNNLAFLYKTLPRVQHDISIIEEAIRMLEVNNILPITPQPLAHERRLNPDKNNPNKGNGKAT